MLLLALSPLDRITPEERADMEAMTADLIEIDPSRSCFYEHLSKDIIRKQEGLQVA
jgi:hypothetical protein